MRHGAVSREVPPRTRLGVSRPEVLQVSGWASQSSGATALAARGPLAAEAVLGPVPPSSQHKGVRVANLEADRGHSGQRAPLLWASEGRSAEATAEAPLCAHRPARGPRPGLSAPSLSTCSHQALLLRSTSQTPCVQRWDGLKDKMKTNSLSTKNKTKRTSVTKEQKAVGQRRSGPTCYKTLRGGLRPAEAAPEKNPLGVCARHLHSPSSRMIHWFSSDDLVVSFKRVTINP